MSARHVKNSRGELLVSAILLRLSTHAAEQAALSSVPRLLGTPKEANSIQRGGGGSK